MKERFELTEEQKISLFLEFIDLTVEEYENNYNKMFEYFKSKYIDATEEQFITEELYRYHVYTDNVILYDNGIKSLVEGENINHTIIDLIKTDSGYDDIFCKRLYYSFIAIDKLLRNKLIELKSDLTQVKTNSLKWHGTKIDLIELSKALIENGTLKGKQKDIINSLGAFFGVDTTTQDKTISDLKKRNNGSETKFLEELKTSLYNYITKENIR